jgi:hypothetical protein
MRSLFSSAFFLLIILFVAASCRQDKDAPDQKQLLSRTWLMSSQMLQRNDGPEEDVYAQMEDCQKDDELIFAEDGTYEMNPGTMECQISFLEEGTWELYGGKLYLSTQEFEVQELSATALRIKMTYSRGLDKTEVTTTYRPK